MAVHQESPQRPDTTARRGRLAVGGLFLVNGFGYTNVVPWIPWIKNQLELSNTALGTAIAAMPFGALLTGMLAGPLISRLGSGRTAVASGLLLAWVLPLLALAPGWGALAAALFAIGCADAWMDAAMNSHGLRVQRRYGRTIINTFHAVWSIAAVGGGLLGAGMAGAGVPLLAHLTAVAVISAGVTLVAARHLLPGPEHAERDDGTAPPDSGRPPRPPLRGLLLPLALGVLLMMAGGIEDSAASWGAVYMRYELGAAAFVAGLPFVACQAMMTVGRLTGDRLTDRFGAVTVARSGALLTAVGLGTALLLPGPATAIAGFGLLGLGVATLFPLTLAAAGNVPGVRSGDGVTLVAWLGRLGFLGFPPLVGVVADTTSLGTGLWVVPAGGLVAVVLAGALRPRR
ncbi:MFS transporter [Allosalinactinospora lopnorensis]|uniref:MFS transporter n=1 Tax=Allosalinactinospora lopnorensis TaxID=1352348 RepID=UPI000623C873|nr:MFS transporter [Allosalinactinospora lopnorensis]